MMNDTQIKLLNNISTQNASDELTSSHLKSIECTFGQMRSLTQDEAESINEYCSSISQDTGINFTDLLNR